MKTRKLNNGELDNNVCYTSPHSLTRTFSDLHHWGLLLNFDWLVH